MEHSEHHAAVRAVVVLLAAVWEVAALEAAPAVEHVGREGVSVALRHLVSQHVHIGHTAVLREYRHAKAIYTIGISIGRLGTYFL